MQEGDLLIEDYPLGRNPFVNQVFVVMEKLNKYEIEGRTYQASQSLRKSGLCRLSFAGRNGIWKSAAASRNPFVNQVFVVEYKLTVPQFRAIAEESQSLRKSGLCRRVRYHVLNRTRWQESQSLRKSGLCRQGQTQNTPHGNIGRNPFVNQVFVVLRPIADRGQSGVAVAIPS